MRRMRLVAMVVALVMSSCCGWVEKLFTDPDLREADESFEKGLFDEAFRAYDGIWKGSAGEDVRFKAFYRSVECLSFLYRYGEAAQRLYETPAPEEMPRRARYLWLEAETLQSFSRQYSWIQGEDVVDGEAGADVFRKTPDEIRADVRSSYEELWKLRDELARMEVDEEDYFLDVEDVDLGIWPTAYDYVVYSWSEYLLSEQAFVVTEGAARPDGDPLLVADWEHEVSLDDPPALLAASLMEEAGRDPSRARRQAAEMWKIARLMLPVHSGHFDVKDSEEAKNKAEAVLVGWFSGFRTKGGKAEAGFQAARLMNMREAYVEAVDMCLDVEDRYAGTYSAYEAKKLRKEIEEPRMEVQARTAMPPANDALTLRTRNKDRAWFRAYAIEPREYREKYRKEYSWSSGWSGIFSGMHADWLEKLMAKNRPVASWEAEVQDPGDHSWVDTVVRSPDFGEGIYLVVASPESGFDVGKVELFATFLNVTNLVLVGTAGPTSAKSLEAYNAQLTGKGGGSVDDDVYRFYTVDARTGEPVAGAALSVYANANGSYGGTEEEFDLSSDGTGLASLALPVNVRPRSFTAADLWSYGGESNWYNADPLATSGKSHSYWSGSHGLSITVPNPVHVFLEMDRPIYRPGHTLQAKAVCVKRTPTGFVTVPAGRTVTFVATDTNGKEFFTKSVELSEMGSASVSVPIPAGKLLGSYQLRAFVDAGDFQGVTTSAFRVEEYKQPEFEVELDEPGEAWKYGEPVKVGGMVTYYFGGPVPGAAVKYKVQRQTWLPWFYSYFYGPSYVSGSGDEVDTGTIETDDEGRFVIDFTPEPPPPGPWQGKAPDIASFTFEIEARDAGGRTISTTRSYRAAEKALYFTLSPRKGFFDAGTGPVIDASLLTVNDTPHEGKSTFEVFRLADEPAKPLEEDTYVKTQSSWGWAVPIDVQLEKVANGKKVDAGKAAHDATGKATIEVEALDPGAYRVVVRTGDPWGGEVTGERIFVVAGDASTAVPVQAASLTLVQDGEVEVGETARIVMGSALANAAYRLEIWQGPYLATTSVVHPAGPVGLAEIPVTEKMKGGFTVRWFGVKNLDVHHGEASIMVPSPEKKLTLAMDPYTRELRPGEQVEWGVSLTGKDGKPARGEVLVFMYDRALEYYATSYSSWMSSLYLGQGGPQLGLDSVFLPGVSTIWVDEGVLEKVEELLDMPEEPPRPPGLRTWETWARGRDGLLSELGLRSRSTGMPYPQAVMEESKSEGEAPPSPAMARSVSTGEPPGGKAKVMKDILEKLDDAPAGGVGQSSAPDVQARGAFSDTAFFVPHVVTKADGKGLFSFVAPEQLTSWRVKAMAFTKDASEGTLTDEVVTKKLLMVRADIPRFFREKDEGTITAIVHNESDVPIGGELFVDVTDQGRSIAGSVGLVETARTFEIEPHSLASFDWMLEVPAGVTTWKVKVTAVAGELADAEERILPILPSRQRLVESAFVTLKGKETKTLSIALASDPTRIDESMVVQVDPQLALSLLETIPFLVEYPYECVEQTLNRYVPLAVLNEIFEKYPDLKKAVAGVPKRTTLTPPWEDDDPRRLITLMETPWVREAEGYTPSYPMTDLLDPAIVEQEKDISMERLRAAQYGDGAFPWWPGGQPSMYMTLLVLAGLAEAQRYGVDVPVDMVDPAISYVNREIAGRLTEEDYDLALTAYAGWVLTSFSPDVFAHAREGQDNARGWTKHLEKHIHALTPFGKAYLAATHHRLGNTKRAIEIVDMIMDSAREDPAIGVYWQPEKYSWVWYSDSVEKHAFILRTLAEIRPDDARIPGMVQWLLFNRKGNQWKSTKASAAAVFALLEYMEKTGALTSKDRFVLTWAGTTESFVVEPDDFFDEPIRFFETGEEITDAHATATIAKDGKGIAFASMTWIYTTDELPGQSAPGILNVKRSFYRRVKEGDAYHLKPIASGGEVVVGDEVVVQLTIGSKSQFEFMHVQDPKAAGFEAEALLSGWRYKPLWIYEEPRDSLTNFFMDWLPAGEYVLSYTLRPTKPGRYRVGASVLQSMYAPEMTAHSDGFELVVE